MPLHSFITLSVQYWFKTQSCSSSLTQKNPIFNFHCFFTMANPQDKKARSDVVSPMATFPEDILETVFTFLPIKEAVQASTVSTNFKSSWRLNKKLLFGREFGLRYNQEELAPLIDRVFDSHKGTEILSFHLHIDPMGIQTLIEKWLRICVDKGVEDLELYFFRPGVILGSDFFDRLKKLKTLKLVFCEMQLSRVLCGMRFLNTLVLWHLELKEESLELLVAHCNMLAVLDLNHCTGIHQANILARNNRHFKVLKIGACADLTGIEIDSPTLGSIFYDGYIPRIRFAQRMVLNEAFFNLAPAKTYVQANDEVEILVNDIQHVSVFTTSALFLEALAARVRGGVIQEAQYRFKNVREVQLFMEWGVYCNPYDIAVFLRNCTSLERLFIDLNDHHFDCGMYWELHQRPMLNQFNHNFTQLRIVKLMGFRFAKTELQLVKVLLQGARFLEQLILTTPYNSRNKLYARDAPKHRDLFNSWKASPTARIVLYEHNHDRSSIHPSHPRDWY